MADEKPLPWRSPIRIFFIMGDLMGIKLMNNYQRWEGFPLKVAAEKTGKLEFELLQLAASGDLELWVWFDDLLTMNGEKKGWFKIPEECADFTDNERVEVESFKTIDGSMVTPAVRNEPDVIYASSTFMDNYRGSRMSLGETSPQHEQGKLVEDACPIHRSKLRVLPHDIEKLANKTPINLVVSEPDTNTPLPLKEYSNRRQRTDLLILAEMLAIITDKNGLRNSKTQEDFAEGMGKRASSTKKRFPDAKKIFDQKNKDNTLSDGENVHLFLIGALTSIITIKRPKTLFYEIKDLVSYLSELFKDVEWIDELKIKNTFALATYEKKDLSKKK